MAKKRSASIDGAPKMTIGPISSRHEAFRQVSNALLAHMRSISVCIVGFKGEKPHEIGSGTCVQIGSRYLIATAAHVIEGYSNENIRIVHTDEPNQESILLINRGAVLDKSAGLDFAWLEIAQESIAVLQKKFISLDQFTPNVNAEDNDIIFVYGFPSQMVDQPKLSQNMLQVTPLGYTTSTREVSRWPADKKADRHILLEWPEEGNILTETGNSIALPEPYGISGGGIWKININNGTLWTPENARMIGIEYSWMKSERWLCGNQIQNWLRLVKESIHELSGLITV